MNKTLVSLAALAVLIPAAAFATVTVEVNGQPIAFDQPPVMQSGRVLVPLRGVFERLGAQVVYNAANRSISAQAGASSIGLQVGSTQATVNGQMQTLDQAPVLVGGRAMVPLRFVSQALGAQVSWNAQQQLVSIAAGGQVGALPPSETYGAPPPPQNPPMESRRPRISQVELDGGRMPDRPLRPGETVYVTLRGTPGCQATFDINGQTGFQMTEEASGKYTGSYTVRDSDRNGHAIVQAHLTSPDGQTMTRNADEALSLGGEREEHPPVDHRDQRGALIGSIVHSGGAELRLGQSMQVTMVGAPGALATFDFGPHRNIPMQEVAPGRYIGTYTVALGEVNSGSGIVGHLTTRDGRTETMRDPQGISILGIPR